jgi:hypothetical protein
MFTVEGFRYHTTPSICWPGLVMFKRIGDGTGSVSCPLRAFVSVMLNLWLPLCVSL